MRKPAERLFGGNRVVTAVGGILAGVALVLILGPQLVSSVHRENRVHSFSGTGFDPAVLVPTLRDLPVGSRVQSHHYVTNEQASRTNGTSLSLLSNSGREIGFTRDFLIPRYGDIEVEVVRFRDRKGTKRAYAYFLTLPERQGLPRPVSATGIGERAAVVSSPAATFLEFVRDRYYVVLTAIPATRSNLLFLGRLSEQVDARIQSSAPSA